MSKYRLTVDFTDIAAADLVPLARNIQSYLNNDASSYPDIPVTSAALDTFIDDLEAALVARENGGRQATVDAELARHVVEDALHQDGEYLNVKLPGTEAACVATNYPYYPLTRAPRPNPPPAPTGLAARQGPGPGVVRLRFKAPWANSFNEAQQCAGDPTVEANWHAVLAFKGGKADIANLTPGALYWFRVRTAGVKGVFSAWSDPAQIRAL